MCLHGGAVDEDVRGGASGGGQGVKELRPDTLGRPSDVPIIECFPWTILGGRVDPAAARLQDVDDPADHAAVIDPRFASRIPRQMRQNPRELFVRQPEQVAIHDDLLLETVNHTSH